MGKRVNICALCNYAKKCEHKNNIRVACHYAMLFFQYGLKGEEPNAKTSTG